MSQNDREKIVHELFGVKGIWSESDSEIIKTRMGNMINCVTENPDKFKKYMGRIEKIVNSLDISEKRKGPERIITVKVQTLFLK